MNLNVGVNVIRGLAGSPIDGVTTAVAAIIGNFERGPCDKATLVTSMAQFENTFGIKPAPGTTGYYSAKGFFAAVGSGQLYVVRVAGGTKAKATYSFEDRQGTPADTLQINAKSEGAWGNNLSIKIADDSLLSTKPSVTISVAATDATLVTVAGVEVGSDIKFYNGTNTEYRRVIQVDASNKKIYWTTGLSNAYTTVNGVITSMEFLIEVYDRGVLLETWENLSMNDAVTFFVEKKVLSDYIAVVDLKSVDTDYQDLPAVVSTAVPLASGNDGLTDVEEADYAGSQSAKTGKYALDEITSVFRFCCPNPLLTDVDADAAYLALIQDLLDYTNTRNNLVYYFDIPLGKTPSTAVTYRENFEGELLTDFWPWGEVYESGLKMNLPPSSVMIGMACDKDGRRGVWKNLGNEKVPYFTGLEYYVSVGEGETLNDAGVNTIRSFAGEGIKTYGGRTCSAVTQWRFLHFIELWCFIARSLEAAMREVIFEPNTPALWQTTIRRVTDFMLTLQNNGAVTEFTVKMDSDNNPQSEIALGKAKIELTYVPVGTVEKLAVIITSTPGGIELAR